MPMMKIADSLRLCAPPPHENCGTLSGSVHPHDENSRHSQALSTRTAEKRGASQAACMPMMKIADSLRLLALFAHAIHENCGTS